MFYLTFFPYLNVAIPRVGDKYHCKHCNKTVGKTTFYEHQALYGDEACGFSSDKEELELDLASDSESEGVISCFDDEDRQFFSEDDTSGDDGEVEPDQLSVKETENSEIHVHAQSQQKILVSLLHVNTFLISTTKFYEQKVCKLCIYPMAEN